jgi:hypothetical protein
VTINSATNVTADFAFNAASLRQVAGTGTTTFTGALSTTAAAGIEVDGTNFDFNDTVSLTLGNSMSMPRARFALTVWSPLQTRLLTTAWSRSPTAMSSRSPLLVT